MPVRAIIPNVRLAFPSIFEPSSYNNNKPRFSGTFIIDSDNKAAVAAIEQAVKDCAAAKWGAKAESTLKVLQATDKTRVIKDGDTKLNTEGDVYDGFGGNLYFTASRRSEDRAPVVSDTDGGILQAGTPLLQPGYYYHASVEFWAQDNQYGKRVNCTLRALRFVKEAPVFGGVSEPITEDEFDNIAFDSTAAESNFGDVL